MTIPALPFDSLYKFLFIGGIFIMAFSVYQRNHYMNERYNHTNKLDSLANIQTEITSYLKRDSLESSINDYILDNKPSVEQLLKIKRSAGMQRIRIDSVQNVSNSVRIAIDTLKLQMKSVDFDDDTMKYAAYFGILLLGIGSWNWNKQQVIQDEILKLQRDTLFIEKNLKSKGIDKTKYRKP